MRQCCERLPPLKRGVNDSVSTGMSTHAVKGPLKLGQSRVPAGDGDMMVTGAEALHQPPLAHRSP